MKTYLIHVRGIVQGVGFRPFIFRLAESLQLKGYVTNDSSGVEICVTADEGTLIEFISAVDTKSPPLSQILEIEYKEAEYTVFHNFSIEPSKVSAGITLVPPDTAICRECASEIADISDRRHLYPFTNCTNCGPRYSIIESMPYDRSKTTMSKFRMCPACQKEYDDAGERRFHAQPNACQVCGPMVYMGNLAGYKAVKEAAKLIDSGQIVAVKGLGGYHLVCDARQDIPVKTLRNLKNRPDKPFAVMCSEETISDYTGNKAELKLFSSPQAPITIIQANPPISRQANPMSENIGFLSPYTPLHQILLEECSTDFLIATSGNRKDEPIAKDERASEKNLSHFTSHFLHHTRPIHNRVDDSLAAVVEETPYILRRARGFAPFPVMLPSSVEGCVLAVGAHLKNTVTIAKGRYAFVSQYIGDLDNPETCSFFEETVEKMKNLYGLEPDSAVCDMHPDYFSSRYAEATGLKLQKVQHHTAHMMACMAENGLRDNVLGVILDGTIWGGEFLLMKERQIKRVCSLPEVMQPGFDSAAKNPGRMLVSYLSNFDLLEENMDILTDRLFMKEKDILLTAGMVRKNINCIKTTSAGRFFESAGALITGVTSNMFEAHSAMKMEGAAAKPDISFTQITDFDSESFFEEVFRFLLMRIRSGADISTLSLDFHMNFTHWLSRKIFLLCREHEVEDVILSGGVFQNLFLLRNLLKISKSSLYRHKSVPPNDSCISLGQAYYKSYSKIKNFSS